MCVCLCSLRLSVRESGSVHVSGSLPLSLCVIMCLGVWARARVPLGRGARYLFLAHANPRSAEPRPQPSTELESLSSGKFGQFVMRSSLSARSLGPAKQARPFIHQWVTRRRWPWPRPRATRDTRVCSQPTKPAHGLQASIQASKGKAGAKEKAKAA